MALLIWCSCPASSRILSSPGNSRIWPGFCGGCLCVAFPVTHPDRSASLVTYGSSACRLRTADYPWGWSAEHLAEVLRGMDQGWASGKWWAAANPSVAGDERYQAWWARYLRAAA